MWVNCKARKQGSKEPTVPCDPPFTEFTLVGGYGVSVGRNP
jgi:hypothetical protein